MVHWLRRSLQGAAMCCLLVVIFAVHQVEDPGVAAMVTVGAGLLGGLGMAVAEHLDGFDRYDERQLLIRYRAGYLAFFAVFWFLFPLVMGGVDNEAATHSVPLSSDQVVFVAWGLGFAVFGTALLYYRRTL